MAVALPNIRCPTYLREKNKKGKNVGAFDLQACEAARSLQARLAGLLGFYDRVPQRGGVKKIINLSEWMKSPWALKSD